LGQPVGEWSINGPGNAGYKSGDAPYCFCTHRKGECELYNNDAGQTKEKGAWDANNPEEVDIWVKYNASWGVGGLTYDWPVAGELPGDHYLHFAAHAPQEVAPTTGQIGCAFAGTEAYDLEYKDRLTGEVTASTTPMPCNLNAPEYTKDLYYRDANNEDQLYGSLHDDATGEVRNPGYVLTNNPFLRMYQKDSDPGLCTPERPCQNIASRMLQDEGLHHAQGAYFISIVICQWSGALVCKTRRLSILSQGMANTFMNFGFMFETILGAWLSYFPPLNYLGTRPLRLSHWCIALPFTMITILYDETRKYWMRITTKVTFDKESGALISEPGWIERNIYY